MAQTIVVSSNLVLFHANDLLDQEVIKSGMFSPAYRYESVADAVIEIIKIMNWTLQSRNLIILSQFDFDMQMKLEYDKRRLQQVLLNLISNAIKFQEAGQIRVNVRIKIKDGLEKSLLIEVQVIDTGIGMTQAEVAKAFVPFWRSKDNTSQNLNKKGNGVGLSICKKICKCLGGDLTLISEPGVGSTFTFTHNAYFTLDNTAEEVESVLEFRQKTTDKTNEIKETILLPNINKVLEIKDETNDQMIMFQGFAFDMETYRIKPKLTSKQQQFNGIPPYFQRFLVHLEKMQELGLLGME